LSLFLLFARFSRSLFSIAAAARCLALFALLLTAAPVTAAVVIRTQLDRETIMAGETATLSVAVEGGTPQTADNFPPIPGLAIQYRGASQNITSVNGKTTRSHILSFAVTPSEPGEYQIPAINIGIGGQPHPTQPVKLTVAKSDLQGQDRNAFLRLNVSRQEIFLGEVIPIEIQLYVTQAENLQQPQLQSDGFVIHKRLENERSQAQIGNQVYQVLTFKMTISAAKAGKLSLGPAQTSLTLLQRAQPDPNDFFGAFGRFHRRQMNLASPVLEVNVLPLPAENVPPEFNGAIGSFNWTVSASPPSVAAGEPITLRIAVTGRGNLDSLRLPDFNWPNFRTYPPNSSVASQDPYGLQGTKSFEQVIVPQDASVREIPALSFAYFDPAKKSYAKLAQAALAITVSPASAGSAQPTVLAAKGAEDAGPLERTDIVHIKTDAGPLLALAPPLIARPWFLALQAVPLLGFIALLLWRHRRDQLANNPKLRRKLQAAETIRAGLADLERLAAAREADPFFAQVFRLLQEQLGERLDLPASAITEAVLEEKLPKRGASPELLQRLQQLFQRCNQARYAPVRAEQELRAVRAELETALRELQALPDP